MRRLEQPHGPLKISKQASKEARTQAIMQAHTCETSCGDGEWVGLTQASERATKRPNNQATKHARTEAGAAARNFRGLPGPRACFAVSSH